MKVFLWHSKAGKLASEFERMGYEHPTWNMLERALDLAYQEESAADSLKGRLEWAQNQMLAIACNSGRLAVRGYQISRDLQTWEFAGNLFEAQPSETMYAADKKTLLEPFTEKFGKICAPIEWVREHCKEVK